MTNDIVNYMFKELENFIKCNAPDNEERAISLYNLSLSKEYFKIALKTKEDENETK